MTGKLLIARIEKAFAEVRREGGLTLAECRVMERGGSEAERKKARAQAKDKRWQDIPNAELEKNDQSLGFLDPKGFRYHLPAYLRWSLRHLESSKANLMNAAIYALSPSANQEVSQRHRECWSLFSPEQNHVIYKFLRFMAARCDGPADTFMAQLALEAHWHQFDQKPPKPTPGLHRAEPETSPGLKG
jgi:hypothetical protein